MGSTPQLLKKKVAIVTGADTGIGKAISIKFVNHGATVFLAVAGKDVKSCETFADDEVNANKDKPNDTTGVAKPFNCEDVSNWDNFSRVIEEVRMGDDESTKNLDIFYYHAEFFNRMQFFNDSGNSIHSMKHNVKTVLDHVGKNVRKGGCILYGSSTKAMVNDAMPLAHGMSQTAATGVVRAKAAELARENVRVNALSQGSFDWRMLRSIFPRASDKQRMQMHDDWMMTEAEAADVANVAVLLASDYGSSVTGHNLLLNGKL
ncbi:unnamed protein product [Urochloa decumbens]|uniref:Uncharacterized protein n=1 Tax=Urochloa decumbens TaxID=240449 RepID=A0ABC9AM03_9POAL